LRRRKLVDANAAGLALKLWIIFHFLFADDADPPVAQSEDGFLNFSSISREHIGWYKCSADYDANTFASSGLFINVRCEFSYAKLC
jgi:hypothetical protein